MIGEIEWQIQPYRSYGLHVAIVLVFGSCSVNYGMVLATVKITSSLCLKINVLVRRMVPELLSKFALKANSCVCSFLTTWLYDLGWTGLSKFKVSFTTLRDKCHEVFTNTVGWLQMRAIL